MFPSDAGTGNLPADPPERLCLSIEVEPLPIVFVIPEGTARSYPGAVESTKQWLGVFPNGRALLACLSRIHSAPHEVHAATLPRRTDGAAWRVTEKLERI